jgi:hypothetical protein
VIAPIPKEAVLYMSDLHSLTPEEGEFRVVMHPDPEHCMPAQSYLYQQGKWMLVADPQPRYCRFCGAKQ